MLKRINDQYFLDRFKRSDKEAMVNWLQEKSIFETTLRIPFPYEAKHADEWLDFALANDDLSRLPVIVVIRNEDGSLVGSVGLEKTSIQDQGCRNWLLASKTILGTRNHDHGNKNHV